MQDFQYPWGHHRRLNSYTEYIRKTFGRRIQKLSIDAGFTCPNRDGTIGTGGCTFCNNDTFNPSYCHPSKSIRQQIEEGKQFHAWRYRRAVNYLAYFQAYSNTYASMDALRKKFEEALSVEGIVGLIIGTRPDCIDDEKLDYFSDLSRNYYIVVEYGVESCFDETLRLINRGHTYQDSVDAITKTAARGIKTGAHLILGLPGETTGQILSQATMISKLPLTTLKVHQLQIVKNTLLADQYMAHPDAFSIFTLHEYIDLAISFIERLSPDIVVERVAGEVPPRFQVSPVWGTLRYDQVLVMIEKKMEELNTWQGKKFNFFIIY